jgi:hypothetical protein
MSNSKLISYTKLSPNRTKPRNHAIDTITIHCMAGNATVEGCGDWFAKESTQASSNYGVGTDGRIALYVDECDRSWCSSNAANDHRAVTIEVANDGGAPDWHVSDKALNALIELCADICMRNNMPKLLWRGDKSLVGQIDKQNMTVHRWFAAKSCPGDYLYNLHGKIADEVNKRLGAANPPPTAPPTAKTPIMGKAACTAAQLDAFTKMNNPNAPEYGAIFIEEGNAEGVRGDISFCQSCLETGFFKFGGDVSASQNNFAGIGTVGGGVKGASFATAREGIRAQIQHLKAYASKDALVNPCADPRFNLVTRGIAPNWEDLNGRWAVPGTDYGQKILKVWESTKAVTVTPSAPTTPPVAEFKPYLVKVTASVINIRKGAGTNFAVVGTIRDQGTYTIVGEAKGQGASLWGKLKSGAGWISLDFCQKQ